MSEKKIDQERAAQSLINELTKLGQCVISIDDLNALIADREALQKARSLPAAVPDVDGLSNFIRQVDGDNKMGAGALAERICDWISAAPAAQPSAEQSAPGEVEVPPLSVLNAGWSALSAQGIDPETVEMLPIYQAMIAARDAGEVRVPECVRNWYEAKLAHVDAVDAYNARLAFIREHMPFGASPDPEYQIMEAADRKARELNQAMFVELRALLAQRERGDA